MFDYNKGWIMLKIKSILILICSILLITTGCTSEKAQEGIVATFDGYTITEKDIEKS